MIGYVGLLIVHQGRSVDGDWLLIIVRQSIDHLTYHCARADRCMIRSPLTLVRCSKHMLSDHPMTAIPTITKDRSQAPLCIMRKGDYDAELY